MSKIDTEQNKIVQDFVASTIEAEKRARKLEQTSVLDLFNALHWTSKNDLCNALGLDPEFSKKESEQLDILWNALVLADRNLRVFEKQQLQKIVAYNQLHQQHKN